MRRASTNTRPPFFGPTLPSYPPLRQLVRVTAPGQATVTGAGNPQTFYPAAVVQYGEDVAGTFRNREPCYVFEANNFPLSGAVYKSRLVGTSNGLPLFVTVLSCCGTNVVPFPPVPVPSVSPIPGSGSSSSAVTTSLAPSSMSPGSPGSPGSLLPFPSSSMSGTVVQCCPGTVLPATLFLTISGTDPTCQKVITLTLVAPNQWETVTTMIGASPTCEYYFILRCLVIGPDPTNFVFELDIFNFDGTNIDQLLYGPPPQCKPLFLDFANTSIPGDFSPCGGCGVVSHLVVTQ